MTAVVKICKFTVFSSGSFCQIYRITDEALIAKTMVWPNFFLINVFFALKGSKLFIIISYHCSWMLCPVAAVKSVPALIYSADIFNFTYHSIFLFLINVFFPLKVSKLFIIITYYCYWMLCHVAVVKSLPTLIYSADYVLLLVLSDHGIYSENSEIIIC